MALKISLIDDWRKSWKLGSVWLAWAAGALAASIIAAAPSLIMEALTAPFGTRIIIGILIGVGLAASAWSSRVLSVQKKDKSDAAS